MGAVYAVADIKKIQIRIIGRSAKMQRVFLAPMRFDEIIATGVD